MWCLPHPQLFCPDLSVAWCLASVGCVSCVAGMECGVLRLGLGLGLELGLGFGEVSKGGKGDECVRVTSV